MLSKITKKVSLRILSSLLSGEASLSALAQRTGTTKANASHTLRELEKLDVVRKVVQGKTHVYRFNALHPAAELVRNVLLETQRSVYDEKLGHTPILLHRFLSHALRGKYIGCIFFGSSLSGRYNDIDVFVAVEPGTATSELGRKIRVIDRQLSPIFGTQEELRKGIEASDMLYLNISQGIPFGLDTWPLAFRKAFLRKEDIQERFTIGYRTILSCREFPEKSYVQAHLEKGVTDVVYAILNYLDCFPRNRKEAETLLRSVLRQSWPRSVEAGLKLSRRYAWIL